MMLNLFQKTSLKKFKEKMNQPTLQLSKLNANNYHMSGRFSNKEAFNQNFNNSLKQTF